ncbi:hypothetical protein [Nocardia grenadensis]|uniref:hypothetical protein n=1 Tax=Nocardia grenadensis TaxID=931537 RepID=UPI003D926B11
MGRVRGAGHADEQQAVVAAVVLVAQVLDRGGGQSFGFVDDDEFGVVGYLALCRASGFDVSLRNSR